jgi:hypothetical protein
MISEVVSPPSVKANAAGDIAKQLESFAKDHRGDAQLHALLHHCDTSAREFAHNIGAAINSTSAELRKKIESM